MIVMVPMVVMVGKQAEASMSQAVLAVKGLKDMSLEDVKGRQDVKFVKGNDELSIDFGI